MLRIALIVIILSESKYVLLTDARNADDLSLFISYLLDIYDVTIRIIH